MRQRQQPPAEIKPGEFVKIRVESPAGAEAFWVVVTRVQGDTIVGTVNNNLCFTPHHGLDYGDEVELERDEVLDWMEAKVTH